MELEFHQIEEKYSGLRMVQPQVQGRLMASLAEQGQLNPVLVVAQASPSPQYVLIDGYRRVSALRALGRDSVAALVLPLNEPAALLFCHCQKHMQSRSAWEDGWLLRELVDTHGMSQAELSGRLQRSESWVSRRLSLVRELPESVQEQVRRGQVCAYGAMKYLVPLARAKKSDCEELVRNLSGHGVSSRQLLQIYSAWKQGDHEQRMRVVSNPLLFLKAHDELSRESPPGSQDVLHRVLKDFEILGAVSARARRGVGRLEALPALVVEVFCSVRSSFGELASMMQERIDVGPRNA